MKRRPGRLSDGFPKWARSGRSVFRVLPARLVTLGVAPPDQKVVTLTGARLPDPKDIGTWRVLDRIAESTTSGLYRCMKDVRQGGRAIKLLSPAASEDRVFVDPFLEAHERLLGFSHPNVVAVEEIDQLHDRPYIVYEYVPGLDLARALRRGPLRAGMALRCLVHAATGLKDVYEKIGILHQDVRPGHFLMHEGTLKVTGFVASQPRRTAQGRILCGDSAYLAPEVGEGHTPSAAADVYALGCTLFELIAGRPPFGAASDNAMLACHAHETIPSLATIKRDVLPEVDALIEGMCAKERRHRLTYDDVIRIARDLAPKAGQRVNDAPTLIIDVGRDAGATQTIPVGETLLGRVEGDGIAIDDGRVSRRHAKLIREGDAVTIEDLASRNGVLVNGKKVERHVLRAHDRITLGDTVLRVEGVAAEQKAPRLEARKAPGPALPASPLRGAFGSEELSHGPQHQARPSILVQSSGNPEQDALRLRMLGGMSARLTQRFIDANALGEVVTLDMKSLLDADAAMWIPIVAMHPAPDIRTAADAEILSCALPAIERALPGSLSLSTTVRVGREGAWGALMAPVQDRDKVLGFVLLLSKSGRFPDGGLEILEGACHLMTERERARGGPSETIP